MRRVWVFIIFACLPGLLPRAASAQSVELSFLVSEDSFQALVDELELQGTAFDDARALWGPYFFDLTQAYTTYVDYARWPRMGRHPALSQHWRINDYGHNPPKSWSQNWKRLRSLERLFSLDQRRLTREFFDGMCALTPQGADIVDSYQRALHRKALLQPGWNLTGGHVDLVRIIEGLSRAYPDSALARSHWTGNFRSILAAYERQMDASLLERDLVILNRPNSETSPPKPEDPEELREWWDREARESAAFASYHSYMRQFNQDTALKLATALPDEEATLFQERANLLISPFAYKTQGWQLWIEQALKQSGLEDDQRDTLLAWQVMYERDRDRQSHNLVRLYDIRSTPENILKRHRRMNEVYQDLRTWKDRMTEEELAYDEAVTEYETFNNEVTAKIRLLVGERAETIADTVLLKLKAQDNDIDDSQMNEVTRERLEQDRESMFPRHKRHFINASEFKQCMETIAFDDEERKAIFESLYDDFHDGFISAREKHEKDYRIAKEKDIRENPDRPSHLPSGQRNFLPSFTLMFAWSQRWIELRLRLEGEFADQVRLFLSDEEHHLWDREVRRLRRLRMLPAIQTHLTGTQDRYVYDLIELVENLDLKPHEKEGLSKLLHDCEMAIDAACYRFESEYDALISEIVALNAARQDPPSDKLEARRERINKSFMVIREAPPNVRHRYVPLIAGALDAGERQRFLEAIDKQEYPWLYLESPSDMFRAALRRDNVLNAEQSLALDEQEKHLNFTRLEFRRQYLALMRRYDKEKNAERLLVLMDDIFKMALRRSDIDRNSIHDLSRLIPPYQREELSLDIRMLLATFP